MHGLCIKPCWHPSAHCGVGPADGNPATMSSYPPELHSILAILIMLNAIRNSHDILPGSSILPVCDNKSATIEVDKLVTNPFYALHSW